MARRREGREGTILTESEFAPIVRDASKAVIRKLRHEKATDDEIRAAKDRMRRWAKYVVRYGKDIDEPRSSDLPDWQKRELEAEMKNQADTMRVEIFGDD